MAGLRLNDPAYQAAMYADGDRLNLTNNTMQSEADTIARARSISNPFTSGVSSGLRGLNAASKVAVAQALKAAGNVAAGDTLMAEADADRQEAALYAPRVQSLRDIRNLTDIGDYAAGMGGQGIASMAPTMAAAAATRGANLRAAARYPLTMLPSVAPMVGESVQALNDDPVANTMTDQKKFALGLGMGLGGAAAEAYVPHALVGNAIKGNLASRLAKAHAGEGASEVASNEINRQVVGTLNPNRDTSEDMMSRADEFAAGAIGGAPLIVPTATAGYMIDRSTDTGKTAVGAGRDVLSAAREKAGALYDTAKDKAIDLAGKGKAAAEQAPDITAEDVGVAVGAGARKAMDAVNKLRTKLDARVVQGANPDLDALLTPQQAPAGTDVTSWLTQDDAARNTTAKRMATAYLTDPDVPDSLRAAATTALNGSDTDAGVWMGFSEAAQRYERDKKFKAGMDDLSAKFEQAGLTIGKTARKVYDGATKGRENAMSVHTDDAFDDLFTKTFFDYTAPAGSDSTEALIKAAQVSPQLKSWVLNGFSATDGGDIFMPAEIVGLLGPDPKATVTALHTLAERQGVISEESAAPRLKAAIAAIDDVAEADNIVEANLLPTAQAKYRLSGADHRDITSAIEAMIETGKFNDAILDELFGHNKDKVLAALHKEKEQQEQAKRQEILDSDGQNLDDENNDDVIANMTNVIAPSEVKARVSYHGPYNVEAESNAKAGLEAKKSELEGQGKAVKTIGAIDHIREVHGDDQASLDRAITEFIQKHEKSLADSERARPEQHLNRKMRVVRAEEADDKQDAIDIPGSEFDSVTGPLGGRNKWGMSPGKNNEYAGPEHGRIWFEKVRNKVNAETGAFEVVAFNTSANRIINRMRQAQKDVGGDRAYGLADQRRMLMQGISSFLNARNADGRSALSGNVGVMVGGKIKWVQAGNEPAVAKLLDQIKLFDGTLADAKKQTAQEVAASNKAELESWVEQNSIHKKVKLNGTDGPEWTADDEAELKRRTAAGEAGVRNKRVVRRLNAQKETAQFVTIARKAILNNDVERIAKILNAVVDDSGEAPSNRSKKSESTFTKRDKQIETVPVRGPDGKPVASGERVNYSEHAQQYDVSAKDEAEISIDAEQKAYENTVRVFDETTGEELHPRMTRGERGEAKDRLERSLPAANQVSWVLDVLRKGVPAFNAAVKSLDAKRISAIRDVLTQMGEAKTADNPIWRGDPPTNMEAFGNRVRAAIASLGSDPDDTPPKGTRENAQSAESPKAKKEMPRAERNALRAEITKMLGDDIAVEFKRRLVGGSGVEISGDWKEGLIRISLHAEDPAGVGAHEAMHEFFNRLLKGSANKDVNRVREILTNAASAPSVVRQLQRLLKDHPNALEQIKDGAEHYQEERLAYAYQFYRGGLLTLGTETRSTFDKITDFFRWAVGKMTDAQKAERLFDAFSDGRTQTADAAAEVLASSIEYRERVLNGVVATLKPILDKVNKLVEPAQDVLLKSDNPALVKILTSFKQPTGEGVPETYFESQQRVTAQYINRFDKLVRNYQPKDLEMAAEYLHAGKEPTDAVALDIYKGVRSMLDEMDGYIREAGVKRWEPDANDGKGEWVTMGRRTNYYPRSYDVSAITADTEGFIADLLSDPTHKKEIAKIVKAANKELERGEVKPKSYASMVEQRRRKDGEGAASVTERDIAVAITNRILNSLGQASVEETESAVGFEPFMRSVNRRSLDWLNGEHMGKWLNKDMTDTVTSYIVQSVKRAEYVRRFDNGGTKLQELMDDALAIERTKLKEQNPTMSAKELTDAAIDKLEQPAKALMALEGTLGYNIPAVLRNVGGAVIAYENVRLLSTALFSQMIDPLGIVIRGGEMKDAWAAYKRGMKEVWASWKGQRLSDADTQIAEEIGTVETVGFLATFGQQYSSMYLNNRVRKINDGLFRYNGMEGFNRAARIQATSAAIGFLKRHKALPQGKVSQEYLDELRLQPDDIVINADGSINYQDPKVAFAIKRWVDGAILRPNSAQRAVWMSDPHYMMFAHMKQFAYSMHDVILKRVAKEARQHDNMAPLAVLASFVPMMIAADTTKSLMLTGDAPIWSHDLGETILHGANRAGLAGMYQPFADVAVAGHGAATLAGPAAEQVSQLFTQPLSESLRDALPGQNVVNMVSK